MQRVFVGYSISKGTTAVYLHSGKTGCELTLLRTVEEDILNRVHNIQYFVTVVVKAKLSSAAAGAILVLGNEMKHNPY